MRYQSLPARCGPAALREALRALGVTRSEDELASIAKTTPEGTGVRGLTRAALESLPGLTARTFREKEDVAIMRLASCLRAGGSAVLCVDDYDHWVACVAMTGPDKFVVADPADEELFLYLWPTDLVNRWLHKDRCFYLLLEAQ